LSPHLATVLAEGRKVTGEEITKAAQRATPWPWTCCCVRDGSSARYWQPSSTSSTRRSSWSEGASPPPVTPCWPPSAETSTAARCLWPPGPADLLFAPGDQAGLRGRRPWSPTSLRARKYRPVAGARQPRGHDRPPQRLTNASGRLTGLGRPHGPPAAAPWSTSTSAKAISTSSCSFSNRPRSAAMRGARRRPARPGRTRPGPSIVSAVPGLFTTAGRAPPPPLRPGGGAASSTPGRGPGLSQAHGPVREGDPVVHATALERVMESRVRLE